MLKKLKFYILTGLLAVSLAFTASAKNDSAKQGNSATETKAASVSNAGGNSDKSTKTSETKSNKDKSVDNTSKASKSEDKTNKIYTVGTDADKSNNGSSNAIAAVEDKQKATTKSKDSTSSSETLSSKGKSEQNKKSKYLAPSEAKSLNAAKANLQAALNANTNSNIAAIREYKRAAAQSLSLEKSVEDQKTKIEVSEGNITTLQKEYAQFKETYTGRTYDTIVSSFTQTNDDLVSISNEIELKRSEYESLKDNLDALNPLSESYDADYAQLLEQATSVSLSISTLEGERDILEAQKISITAEIEDYNAYVDKANSLSAEVNDLIDEYEILLSQLDTLAKEADAAQQSEIEVMKSKFKTDNLSEDDLADLRAYLGIE